VGSVRIGVAVSDPDGLGHPGRDVTRDRRKDSSKHLNRLGRLVAEYGAVEVIVGLPRTLADRTGPAAQDAIAVAELLAQRISPIPVRLADERLTTVTAQRSLREAGVRAKGQRAVVDQAAAVAILQSWLDQRRAAARRHERRPMTEDWDNDRAHPVAVGPPRYRLSRAARLRAQRRRRRRRTIGGVALAMALIVVVATVFLGSRMWHGMFGSPSDYAGDGGNDVVIQVHDGDSTTAIAQTLLDHQVVATVKASSTPRTAVLQCRPSSRASTRWRTEIPAHRRSNASPTRRTGWAS